MMIIRTLIQWNKKITLFHRYWRHFYINFWFSVFPFPITQNTWVKAIHISISSNFRLWVMIIEKAESYWSDVIYMGINASLGTFTVYRRLVSEACTALRKKMPIQIIQAWSSHKFLRSKLEKRDWGVSAKPIFVGKAHLPDILQKQRNKDNCCG